MSDDLGICLWDNYVDERGRRQYPCRRSPAPDRRLCVNHVGVQNRIARRRARNKVARRTRKAAR